MFESIHLTNLRHNEFIQFIINYLEILSKNDLTALKLQPQSDNLSALIASMIALYKPDKGSSITKILLEDDNRRDKSLVGIQTVINAYTYHFDAEIKESADVLTASLKKYGTAITKQNYQGETATVNSILDEWKRESAFVNAINKLALTDWVVELGTANTQFNTDYLDRAKEDAESPEIKIVDLRKQIIQAYYELSNRVNAFATIGEVETYTDMVKHSNSIIEKYNAVIVARAAKTVEEEIPTQE
ncbi:DUF6261 family protein [Labilibaculum antarcticum]|uniref:Uncharacterized protein n=1 Tax=Labilibaculum antarcticum TaxID=1717717 RepID=A0A1Y1CKZ1_9BACT|nr:DUF6261 family protein [Labilibaculum antarcticum]BAX80980.1 hypothetical protein ALGA_2667 [Labilibaculum antarcticum]